MHGLDNTNEDQYAYDYKNIFKTANALYIISTLDLWPQIMLPVLNVSKFYVLYYIPYLVLFLLLFSPIPIAVLYNDFTQHRLNLLLIDRIIRREALIYCFKCLCNKKKILKKKKFISFFEYVYGKVEVWEQSQHLAQQLWNEISQQNIQQTNFIDISQFLNLLDITEQNTQLSLLKMKPYKFWIIFRQYLNNKFKLQYFILEKKCIQLILVVEIIAFVNIIINFVAYHQKVIQLVYFCSILESFVLLVNVFEAFAKIIVLGVQKYFNNNINQIDFLSILFQFLYDNYGNNVVEHRIIKMFNAIRLLKIKKIIKLLKYLKYIRDRNIMQYFSNLYIIIQRVQKLISQIFICIPIVLRFSIILFVAFYIYSVIGVEIFTTIHPRKYNQNSKYTSQMCSIYQIQNKENQDFDSCSYANFNSIQGAFLILLQVSISAGWSQIQFDYAYKFDSFFLSLLYFNTFNFFSIFILSLISGNMWEIFKLIGKKGSIIQEYEGDDEIKDSK
ncbi:hypothetical protein IMG5_111980 [Ichthyophthirius multifiliis]|uniref:Ion transport domain-containing protein n=1 Tax=Ichthyophthirius multifiliis TaxID=5932 RepID=G0QTV0_ICHMU|nr:hypothetical protein IMG5_111980 [Ichthyophthirius multifiliis]EGR31354.1 hypothetical protein IMG5_111980 [Ichthyophthirius multifiliis]|eukprot:XP_004034840.1 hypothetical protein IMG5_111980 [Ichthyophthirius multifiliis]